jgi:hypothetical protein
MLGVRTSRAAWSSNEISLRTRSRRYQSPQIKHGQHDMSQAGNRFEMAPRKSKSIVLTSIELNGFPL